MSLQKILRERILSVIGIVLVAAAADGILAPELFVYNSPLLGAAGTFSSTQTTVAQIASLTDWPFYVPLLIGTVLIALDIYYYLTKNKVKIA